jgi:glycogen debranching enzyme
VRLGPLARLGRHPRDAYYGDYAGPLMFVISLAHLYAWSGEKSLIGRHWDAARRALDWARERGDLDGDGYLEYRTRSPQGLENQGWKDSGDAIVDDDGTPVARPVGTCELQGYWFAAQQLMAVMSWVMDAPNDAKAHWASARDLKERFNRDWWMEDEGFIALARDPDKRLVRPASSNVGHCVASGIVSDEHLPRVVGRLFAPDMFSGWGVRTLSADHVAYNPVSYHLGSVWAVENATIAFGLRRFGFDARALELTRALFDLAALYPDYRIPEAVGGYGRGERPFPGAYPRANAPQLWNASAVAQLVHTILGLQPVAPLHLLVVDPVLPTWLPQVVLHGMRLGDATATIRFWRDTDGVSHAEVLHRRGPLHVIKQPPLESLGAGVKDRFTALTDRILHH